MTPGRRWEEEAAVRAEEEMASERSPPVEEEMALARSPVEVGTASARSPVEVGTASPAEAAGEETVYS